MILLLIYCCCYNDDDVKDNEDKQWWQCSYLYPAHCIPSPLSPSSLSMTPASIWLYWNLVSAIIIIMMHMMMMIIDHDVYDDDDHVHLYPPSSVCLTPIQTGLSTGRTRCSSSTSRWKSSIWIMIWYDDNADKDNAYNDDNDDEDNDDKDDETSPRVSNSSIMLRCLWQLNLAVRKSASSSRVLLEMITVMVMVIEIKMNKMILFGVIKLKMLLMMMVLVLVVVAVVVVVVVVVMMV